MTTGLVLIAAILVLGGVIATVGDRLGMKVGRSRLTLFKLRPRQTATLITVLTGVVISASTFGILFAVSDQLRTGVFELEEIQDELDTARNELGQAEQEKRQTQSELRTARSQQRTAQRRLQRINRSLSNAVAQQEQTEQQLNTTQAQLSDIETNYRQAQSRLQNVTQQAATLRNEIQQLQRDREEQIRRRNEEIAQRDQIIQEKEEAIAQREELLSQLEEQRAFLIQEVQSLEREFQGLRQGNVALLRNQTLASGVVRVVEPNAAPQAIDQLLREANRVVLQRVQPGNVIRESQVIQVSLAQVEQVVNQIRDGQDYVVRVISAGNYVVGEPCVLAGETCIQVFVTSAPNEIVFQQGEIVATTTLNPATVNNAELLDRINLLIAASQFRSRQAGVIADTIQIADGRTETVAAFFETLQQFQESIEIQAVAAGDIFTAGPVRLELKAVQDGQTVLSTDTNDLLDLDNGL